MPQPDPASLPPIELDLEAPARAPRHARPVSQVALPTLPKVEPVLGATDVGSDETERTLGWLFLASGLPGLMAAVMGHNAGALSGTVMCVVFGVGLLRREDTIRRWVILFCVVNLVTGLISALVFPRGTLYLLGGLAQATAILVLASGTALSRQVYRLCLGTVGLGVLLGIIGAFRG